MRFPKIPFNELIRLREEAGIPVKELGDKGKVGAWILAKRMKLVEAHAKTEDRLEAAGAAVAKTDPSKHRDWENTLDFLTQALADRRFDVLDEFCKAWGKWEIAQDIAADSADGLILTSGHAVNGARAPRATSVIQAILELQGGTGASQGAPTFKEIQAHLVKMKPGDHALDDSQLSKALAGLGLGGRIPTAQDLSS